MIAEQQDLFRHAAAHRKNRGVLYLYFPQTFVEFQFTDLQLF